MQVSSLISSLELTIEKGELTENDVHHVKEIEKVLMSEQGDKVSKSHLQLLGEMYIILGDDLILLITMMAQHI